jgi:hypothetical protein
MNRPIENQQTRSPEDDRLVDRLVDGELADAERRELLLRFEREPDGWRRCALAFLEAQNGRQAFGPLMASDVPRPIDVPLGRVAGAESSKPRHRMQSQRPWRAVVRLTGLAAGLAAAFALGWSFHSRPEEPAPHVSSNQQAISSESPQAAPVELATGAAKPKSAELALLDPLIKEWEQQGYSVETQQRLVPVESKDGRKLNLPVQEVRLRYTRNHTY